MILPGLTWQRNTSPSLHLTSFVFLVAEPPVYGNSSRPWCVLSWHIMYVRPQKLLPQPISLSWQYQITGYCWSLILFHWLSCSPILIYGDYFPFCSISIIITTMNSLLRNFKSASVIGIDLSFSTLHAPGFFFNINESPCLWLCKFVTPFFWKVKYSHLSLTEYVVLLWCLVVNILQLRIRWCHFFLAHFQYAWEYYFVTSVKITSVNHPSHIRPIYSRTNATYVSEIW